MTKKSAVQTKDVPSTPEIELKILESGFSQIKKALDAKREQLGLRAEYAAKEERAAFLDAFTLGDDLDDERAVRAAALLLDWSASDGMEVVSAQLALGISKVLCMVADDIARTQQHFTALKEKTGDVD